MKLLYSLVFILTNISSCNSQVNSFNVWVLDKDFTVCEVYNFDTMTKTKVLKYPIKKDSTFQVDDETIYFNPETPASLSNLSEFLSQNTPIINDNIEYHCVVGFIVDNNGSLKNVGLIRGNKRRDYLKLLFDLMRKMPEWKPAKHNGQNVSSFVKILIKFKVD
jgi:hypothetical protein